MASTEVEQLQVEIIGELCQLNRETLAELCDYLLIAGGAREHVDGKSQRALIRLISDHIERDALDLLEDKGMADLLDLRDKITELQTAAAAKEQETREEELQEEEKLRREIEALQLQLAEKQKKTEYGETKTQVPSRISTQTIPHSYPPTPWRKDFKISGQIGDPGQKDRLTFSSLARQIEHGLSKGVPELEIVDAVIRSIIPGLQLRSYLEGRVNLTLPTLRRILRSHYQEKSATELYKQLTSEVQGIKETPQSFLIRTLDLRQKILFASQEAESGLKYDPGLVQNMFLHTVLTGLQNDSIKRDLQPYLEQTDISDELLLEKMNTACAYETERQNKRKLLGQPRPATIHSVQSSDVPVEKNDKSTTTQQSPAKPPPAVVSQLEEIRSEMALLKDLKAEVSQLRETMQQPQPNQPQPQFNSPQYPPQPPYIPQQHQSQTPYIPPQPKSQFQYNPQQLPASLQQFQGQQPQNLPPGFTPWFDSPRRSFPPPNRGRRKKCFGCQQRGTEDFCTHCFRCGSSEHYLAGCRVRGQQGQLRGEPLNDKRSLARGGE